MMMVASRANAQPMTEPGPDVQAASPPAASTANGQPAAPQSRITCTSNPGEREHCAADTTAGVALVGSIGTAPCLLGRTWGYDDTGIWVSDGCSGEFIAGQAVQEEVTKRKPLEHVPNVGFLLYSGEKGEVYFRLFSYVRYLNQRNIDPSYTDSFGVERSVQQRQDIQLAKFFSPFAGWFLTPKFRYYLYVWSSNASQGDPAQVVGAGNLSYVFNRFVTVGAGITSLPTVRSTEGQFPYWLGVDGRLIADEFFRGLVHQRRLGQGRPVPETEVQRHVRHQPEHPRRERVADRQQDGHAVLRAELAADHGRVRPVRDVRRLRLSREGGDAGRRALVAQPGGQAEPAGDERDRKQPDPPHRRQRRLHAGSLRQGHRGQHRRLQDDEHRRGHQVQGPVARGRVPTGAGSRTSRA